MAASLRRSRHNFLFTDKKHFTKLKCLRTVFFRKFTKLIAYEHLLGYSNLSMCIYIHIILAQQECFPTAHARDSHGNRTGEMAVT